MDAQLVWQTWRKILASDQLRDSISAGIRQDCLIGMSPAEQAILADYAQTPAATETNISMFRRGLVRNARGALRKIPLARRLIEISEPGLEQTLERFVADCNYKDFGPNVWTAAAAILDWIETRTEFSTALARDVITIEGATLELARSLCDRSLGNWPIQQSEQFNAADLAPAARQARFCSSPAARLVETFCDLTTFLEDPANFTPRPDESLEPGQHWWIVYFPQEDGEPEYAELSERGAAAFRHLLQPDCFEGLCRVAGLTDPGETLAALTALCELGVVSMEGQRHPPPAVPDPVGD
jgi:hypothetical protein